MCGFCAKSYKRTSKERQGIYQLLISIICNDMIMKWIKCSFIHQTKMWPFNHLRKKNFHLLPKVPHLASLSALRCRGDPIPLRSALPGWSHPSPLYGIGTIPPLSAMRCRGETILLRFAVSGWDYPSPLYGVGTIPSLSAMRSRGETILLRFTVSGRSHPSPLYGAGSIPSLSALWCRGDPIPLRSALPGRSHSSSLYHDNEIDGECKFFLDSVQNRIKELLKNGRGYISY